LALDVHAASIVVERMIDGAKPQPPQTLKPADFLAWAGKQVTLAKEVISCYEAGPTGFWLHRQLTALGVTNYVVCPNFSDGFTIGYEAVTEVIEGITLKNCDILYARGATKAGQHSAFSIIGDGPATVRDVTFEDTRVEENITRMFELNVTDGAFCSQAPPGRIQGVRLKNIFWEKACLVLITGHNAEHLVEDVVFEGCRVAGVPLSALLIQTNEFTRRIVVR
jgi:hypothetical protein